MAKKTKPAEEPEEEARIEYVRLSDLAKAKRNPKGHSISTIVASIRRHGFVSPLVENAKTGRLVAGHGRLEAVLAIKAETPDQPPKRVKAVNGEWFLPVVRGVSFPNEQRAEEFLLADNRLVELGGWDNVALAPMLEEIGRRGAETMAAIGWTSDDIASIVDKWKGVIGAGGGSGAGNLADRFLVPPFSVLDARQGYWQDRKRAWLALGIKSELGRVAPIGGGADAIGSGESHGGGGRSLSADNGTGDRNEEPNRSVRNRAAPGGSPRPAMKIRGGKTERGDGAGRPL